MKHDVQHRGTVHHDVQHHFPDDAPGDPTQQDRIEALLIALGVSMTVLSEAVADVRQRVITKDEQQDALIAALQAQLDASNAALLEAMANDASDAQTIADKQAQIEADAAAIADLQAQIDAANADVVDAVAVLDTINPDAVEPPPEEPPAEG